MKTMLLLPLLLACSAALAADPVPASKPTAKPDAVKTATTMDGRSASGPVVKATGSQQNRMRECNKSATGKKGAERKAFMKTCLSTHKG